MNTTHLYWSGKSACGRPGVLTDHGCPTCPECADIKRRLQEEQLRASRRAGEAAFKAMGLRR